MSDLFNNFFSLIDFDSLEQSKITSTHCDYCQLHCHFLFLIFCLISQVKWWVLPILSTGSGGSWLALGPRTNPEQSGVSTMLPT